MKSAKTKNAKPEFKDTFIREVQVNYISSSEPKFKITGPSDSVSFLRSIFPDNSREHFLAIFLDGNHQVVCFSVISTGTANSSLVHPREVFQRAILAGAISIIVAHNHPSGSLTPSSEDRSTTCRIKEAGEILGIKVLDSLIITATAAYSIVNEEQV
jgi:DNA repair protein RadC